jgi:hypothetical protein
MKTKTLVTITILISLLVLASPVSAASKPMDVNIISPLNTTTQTGTFTASGPAVDAGLICPSGDVIDMEGKVAGNFDNGFINLRVKKLFVCDDSSGTFDVYMNVKVYFDPPYSTAIWRIAGGTGDYATLKGAGSLVGEPLNEFEILDIYDGKVH